MNINKRKILVVDDDHDFVESITLILDSTGYETLTANSGERCLEILQYEKPDLIILDIMMETITEGFNIGHEIKSNPIYKDIPVIMVSSIKNDKGFQIDKEFIHADEFLSKPFDPNIFLECVKKLLH